MNDSNAEIDFDWEPEDCATGPTLYIKVDKPETLNMGNTKVNAATGKTDWGFELPSEEVQTETSINVTSQATGVVLSIGGTAFSRPGLEDMAPGGVNEVKIGDRIRIADFSNKSMRNPKTNKRTLVCHVLEHNVKGKFPRK